MFRKLFLTGFVLLIGEGSENARVLVALLVSTAFLALQLFVKPHKRAEDRWLMTMVMLALVLIYTCVLLIKTCRLSPAACQTFGFGGTANGVYLFFIFFGLSMLLLLLVVSVINLYVTGRVPKLLLVARAHAVSPATILKRMLGLRARELQRRITKKLGLDILRVTWRLAASIYEFRSAAARSAPALASFASRNELRRSSARTEMPEAVQAVVAGRSAELCIEEVFPRTTCFVLVDLSVFAIRWTNEMFISLHIVESVELPMQWWNDVGQGQRSSIHMAYSGDGGTARVLELKMPESKANVWVEGLQVLINSIPRFASPSHWRWALRCMAATSEQGTRGFLRSTELRALLVRANASAFQSFVSIQEGLEVNSQIEEALGLQGWLRTGAVSISPGRRQVLNARQVTGLLLQLCSSSREIEELYKRYRSPSRCMQLGDWLRLVQAEQLTLVGEPDCLPAYSSVDAVDDAELVHANWRFETVIGREQTGIHSLQFALLLLSSDNTALLLRDEIIAPATPSPTLRKQPFSFGTDHDDLDERLAHYWTATSHNSYLIGDQLTGQSSADAYRRQLLQGTCLLLCRLCRACVTRSEPSPTEVLFLTGPSVCGGRSQHSNSRMPGCRDVEVLLRCLPLLLLLHQGAGT